LAVTAALATTPPASFALAAITAVLAGVALAAVIATPIPKYKHGRKRGPAEMAIVGDGGRPEVVTDKDGSNPRLTPSVPTFTYLKEDDIVHSSTDAYKRSLKYSMYDELDKNANMAKVYQIQMNTSKTYDKEILEELKRNTKAVQRSKSRQTPMTSYHF